MIVLEIKDYCHSCMDFEARVERPRQLYANGDPYITVGDTTIKCENFERCERLKQRLERSL